MAEHPLRKPMREWLPELDFGVMHHGFAPHGRDYVLVLRAAGTYEMMLTHVVEMHYETRGIRRSLANVLGRLPDGLRRMGGGGGT